MKRIDCSILAVLLVDLLATTGDVTLSWTSPIYPKLYSNNTVINPLGRRISKSEDGWMGSLLNFGAIIGSLPFGYISDKFGRKVGLLSIAVPHIVSFLTFAFAKKLYLFYMARFLGGLALGGGYSLCVIYIAEISKDSDRGKMCLSVNVFCAIGNFLPFIVGPFTSIFLFNAILALIPSAFFLLFLLLAPETPYYLVGVGKEKEAEESLMYLRSKTRDEVAEELDYIKAFVRTDQKARIIDILTDKIFRKSFLICLLLIATQDLSGFCAITYHLQSIFEATGTKFRPDLSAIIVGVALLLSSFIAPFLVDKIGRKPLITCSCLGMFLALNLLAGFFYIHDRNFSTRFISWLPIVSLMLYITFFNVGICTVPWTLMSELFPNNAKQMAAAVASCFSWTSSFLVAKSYHDMNNALGRSGTFWVFSSTCLLCAVFSAFCLQETKGKSFGQIRKMLSGSSEID